MAASTSTSASIATGRGPRPKTWGRPSTRPTTSARPSWPWTAARSTSAPTTAGAAWAASTSCAAPSTSFRRAGAPRATWASPSTRPATMPTSASPSMATAPSSALREKRPSASATCTWPTSTRPARSSSACPTRPPLPTWPASRRWQPKGCGAKAADTPSTPPTRW